nr:hypothetical protein Iba_chr14aCG3040 [Ipomoea batatas]GMD91906.1 hypothetical protein Iba_chr14eCG3950 [Ipomoea batatas]
MGDRSFALLLFGFWAKHLNLLPLATKWNHCGLSCSCLSLLISIIGSEELYSENAWMGNLFH